MDGIALNNLHLFPPPDPLAAITPSLGPLTVATTSLPSLQALFQANPTTDSVMTLVHTQYKLNNKQSMVAKALFNRILDPVSVTTVDDQFLLYLGGVGGVGKTHLIKAFIFGLSITQKHHDVLLTASTGAAAANINGATYHSALALYGNRPVGEPTKLRLAHKKIFIIDEVSMVSLEALIQLNDRCNAIWDHDRQSSTILGGLHIVIFLGDFNQFTPVGGRALWNQNANGHLLMQAGRFIWSHFNKVVFLTEQMRQSEDLPFQAMLERARSGTLTEDDVTVLNSQTIAARIARGKVPPDRSVIRANRLREQVNLQQLEIFAQKRKQKIYLFPARHHAPKVAGLDRADLLKMMFQVGEVGTLKGPGFVAFTRGMPVMLLQNTNTSAGLVNGMTGTAEEAVLDKAIQGRFRTSPYVTLVDCYNSLLGPARRPIRALYRTTCMYACTPNS
jgi:ATP-dependent exoDNAse (exonuclease V) alpha subunit